MGNAPAKSPSKSFLQGYGVSADLLEFIKTLNFADFSDFPQDQLVPLNSMGPLTSTNDKNATVMEVLNAWQVRHASLVVKAAKEINELRFVLCPRYMTDARFWHIYFTLTRKYLPDEAFHWVEGDPLPDLRSQTGTDNSKKTDDASSFAIIGSQLRHFSSKIQEAAQSSSAGKLELSNLTSYLTGDTSASPQAIAEENPVSTPTPRSPAGILEADPDLEEYLKEVVDCEDAEENEELDLEQYLQELSADFTSADDDAQKAQPKSDE